MLQAVILTSQELATQKNGVNLSKRTILTLNRTECGASTLLSLHFSAVVRLIMMKFNESTSDRIWRTLSTTLFLQEEGRIQKSGVEKKGISSRNGHRERRESEAKARFIVSKIIHFLRDN